MRRRDVLTQTFVVLLATTLVELSRVGGWFSRFLLYVFAPIGAAFVHVLLSPKRELRADALAASATGTAHDLADALMRLDRAAELVDFAASPATEPLYPVDPFEIGRGRADVQDAPAARGPHSPAARARRRARTAAFPSQSRSSPGSSENITESRMRPSGWRRCARKTPSRWNPTFSATRCEATLSGSVISSSPPQSSSSRPCRAQQPHSACARPAAAGGARHPVADPPPVVHRVEPIPMPPATRAVELDRQRVVIGANPTADERACVFLACTDKGCRNPVRDLGVVAGGDERRYVGLSPRPQHEIAVPQLHRSISSKQSRTVATRANGLASVVDVRVGIPRRGVPDLRKGGRRPTLPGACAPSTIGAGGLNFSVRNGKRCIPAAMTAQIVERRLRRQRRARTLKTP